MLKKLAATAMGALLCISFVTGIAPHETIKSVAAPESGDGKPSQSAVMPLDDVQDDELSAYLFVHFIDNEETADKEQIYFSVSKNGTNWRTLNNKQPVLRSEVGERGVRDPHIVRSPDGNKFYMIATDLSIFNINGNWGQSQSAGSQNIVVWESENLVDWNCKGLKKIAPKGATFTWAPESIYDVERDAYMVFWSARTPVSGSEWTYRVWRCYTKDFDTFTMPEVYIEVDGHKRIDTTFIHEGDTYYRFTKNEDDGAKYVYMEKSKSLSGVFEMVNTYTVDGRVFNNQNRAYEGPTGYKLNGEDKWCLLLDSYNYWPFVTEDLDEGVFTPAQEFNFGGTLFRHGCVLPIKGSEYKALIDKWNGGEEPFEEDATTGELVYSLDFEDNLNAGEGTVKTAATKKGNPTYETGVNGGKAIKLSAGNYVQVPAAALAGSKSVTVSFATKVADDKTAWMFFAAANDDEQIWQGNKERYLGIGRRIDSYEGITVQRFNNNGSRPTSATFSSKTVKEWMHITVVFHVDSFELYVNGQLKSTVGSGHSLKDILGDSPVIYLGRANWGTGEYGNSSMDKFKVYNYVLDAAAVKELYETDMGESQTEPQPEPEVKKELIYALDFEGGQVNVTTGEAQAIVHGTLDFDGDDYFGHTAATFVKSEQDWIEIPKAPHAGHETLTISYAVKVKSRGSWVFFAAYNQESQNYNSWEQYIGTVLNANNGNLDFERYFSHGEVRPAQAWWGGYNEDTWVHITLVYEKAKTIVYANGEKVYEQESAFSLDQLFSEENHTLQIGKGNWGTGEYSDMVLALFQIHNYAMSADEVSALYNSVKGN